MVSGIRAYLADRTVGGSLAEFVAERENEAERRERQRILGDLHDNAKQSVRGTSMMIAACMEAQRRGDPKTVQDLLERALRMSREAGYQLHEPFADLGITFRSGGTAALLRQKFRGLCADFGMKAREDLCVDLELLDQRDLAIAHKVCMEAFWNAIKHSGSETLGLESRLVGRDLVLRVRDDGRGFCPAGIPKGLGLGLMRKRANEAGAGLRVTSAPGSGTTVELRFGT